MTAQSFTGTINTDGEFESVATLTELTLTSGKKFNMQVQGVASLKVGDAVFVFKDEKFDYKASSEDLYIKTSKYRSCTLTILEVEN